MRMNDAREILAGRYPNRTVCVSSQCWHNVFNGGATKRTLFFASIWYEIGDGIDKRGDADTLDGLLAQFPGVDSDTDAQAQADAEVASA